MEPLEPPLDPPLELGDIIIYVFPLTSSFDSVTYVHMCVTVCLQNTLNKHLKFLTSHHVHNQISGSGLKNTALLKPLRSQWLLYTEKNHKSSLVFYMCSF